MEIETFCPFGAKCEEAVDGKIRRCQLYTNIKGFNPQTGEPLDLWECAIVHNVLMLIEASRTNQH